MKRFRFSMQTVLDVRLLEEEQSQLALLREELSLKQLEKEKYEFQQRLEINRNTLNFKSESELDIEQLKLTQKLALFLDSSIQSKELEITDSVQELNKLREIYISTLMNLMKKILFMLRVVH